MFVQDFGPCKALGCGLHEVPEDRIAEASERIEGYEPDPETSGQEEPAFEATKADVIARHPQ